MPPKKKTKKQIQEEQEKLQEELRIQEELERKRREEEEARRIEEERKQRELEEQLKKEEEERLQEEIAQMDPWLKSLAQQLITIKHQNQEQEDWNKFLKCDSMPDPASENQLTAYITLMFEEKMDSMEKAANKAQEAEDLIGNLQYSLADALEEYNQNKETWCLNYIHRLRVLATRKLDEASVHIMQHVNDYLQKMPEIPQGSKAPKFVEPIPMKDSFIIFSRPDIRIGLWINYQSTGHKFKPIEFEGLNMHADIPRQYADDPYIMRVQWTSFDLVSALIESQDMAIGGVFEVTILKFPEISKPVKEWLLTPVGSVENTLIAKPYPPNENINANVASLKLSYQLPPHVYLPELSAIKLSWWDTSNYVWTDQDITEIQYDQETKIFQFKVKKLAPMAVIIPRITDYPYKHFNIRAVSDEEVLLDVIGKRLHFSFVIKPGSLQLLNKQGIPEFEHLHAKKFPPGVLLAHLYKCGVNLIPEPRDCAAGGIINKNIEAEELAVLDISMHARTFAFRSSKWNQELPEDMICVRVRENLEYDEFFAEDEEGDWRTVVWYPNKCSFVNLKENAVDKDLRMPEGTVTHFLMHLLMRDNCSEEAQSRMAEFQSIHLADTLKRTLRMLKILSFT